VRVDEREKSLFENGNFLLVLGDQKTTLRISFESFEGAWAII